MTKAIHKSKRKAVEAVVGKVHDLQCTEVTEMYFDVLRKQGGQFKNSEEGRYTMCRAMERIAERNKAEGKRETMLANGKLMLKEIAECSGLSLAQVKKLQASMA